MGGTRMTPRCLGNGDVIADRNAVMCGGRCRGSISLGLSAFVVYTGPHSKVRIIVSGALTLDSPELFGWRAIITRAFTINRCGPTQRS